MFPILIHCYHVLIYCCLFPIGIYCNCVLLYVPHCYLLLPCIVVCSLLLFTVTMHCCMFPIVISLSYCLKKDQLTLSHTPCPRADEQSRGQSFVSQSTPPNPDAHTQIPLLQTRFPTQPNGQLLAWNEALNPLRRESEKSKFGVLCSI